MHSFLRAIVTAQNILAVLRILFVWTGWEMGGGETDPGTCLGRPLGNGAESSYKEIAGCSLLTSKLGSHKAAMKHKKEPFTPAQTSLQWLRKAMGIQTPWVSSIPD